MALTPFLILQLRPEQAAADNELEAFLKYGDLSPEQVRRVRLDYESLPLIKLDNYSGVIVGGGPCNISDPASKKSSVQKRYEKQLFGLLDKIVAADFPFLGACYGIGLLNSYLGGEVSKERYSEPVGPVTIKLKSEADHDPLTSGLPASFRAFGGHKEACQNLANGLTSLASSDSCPIQMVRLKKNIYATQFHTELDQTGLALRINIYKHAGYFPPEEADTLIAQALEENITQPEKILNRFVKRNLK